MTIDVAYTRWADRYDTDRNLTRDLDRSVTAEVLGARRFGMTIEPGCGTGKNTSFLASVSESMLAMDFSAGMLARARERVRASHVTFQHADVLAPWPCGAGTADLVSCNLVLEHVEALDWVFREAARTLTPGGVFFICELHPFRQYLGSQANFVDDEGSPVAIRAYPHHVSDFLRSAAAAGFTLERLDEWWHAEDGGKPPRLLSLLLRRGAAERRSGRFDFGGAGR
ncbi:MAG: class I SAM-dependent methyltransferase [Gemmatimonadaceae bacterium]